MHIYPGNKGHFWSEKERRRMRSQILTAKKGASTNTVKQVHILIHADKHSDTQL